jgi:GNAT superfamily N-acetyltransferase
LNCTIRPFDNDFAAVAALLSSANNEPITAAELEASHARFPAEGARHRLVGVTPNSQIVAYANAMWWPGRQPGNFWFTLTVDPAFRRQGIGSVLLAELERTVRNVGGARLGTGISDADEAPMAFARRHGHAVESVQLQSTLDLAMFEEARFAQVVDRVQAGGIRFFPYTDMPGQETQRKLYELYKWTDLDSPGYLGTNPDDYPPFERWQDELFGTEKTLLDGLVIAADGDRFVGMTVVQQDGPEGSLYTEYTGVLKEYRGRQIGLALKLLSVEYARAYGATSMWTKNNSGNRAMLAINDKMGYVKTFGRAWLCKELA